MLLGRSELAETGTINVIPVVQMRKLQQREAKWSS